MLPVVVNMGAWGIPPPPTRLEEIACEAGVPDNVMRQWLRAEIVRRAASPAPEPWPERGPNAPGSGSLGYVAGCG